MTFTKLFSSITESTIWVEPSSTRIVWITMLAMADRKGRVWASIPGLANRARVTIEECEAALVCFQSPDKYSRTPDFEGRRIAPMDGGWQLLNYAKYRAVQDEEQRRESKRDWDRENRGKGVPRGTPEEQGRIPSDLSDSDNGRHGPSQAEEETEEELNLTALSGKPDEVARVKGLRAEAVAVLAFLNSKAGRNYQPVDANVKPLVARFREGFTAAQCRQVIAKKVREWGADEKMEEFLRPKTLFNATNFANYCGELVASAEAQHG